MFTSAMGSDIGRLIPKSDKKIDYFREWKLAVDGYNSLYSFLAAIRTESGDYLKDSRGRVTSHLSGLFYRNVNLLETFISPVYIFDGQPHWLKRAEIHHRAAVKEHAEEQRAKAVEAGDLAAARRYAAQTVHITSDILAGTKALLDAMGIPWLVAPSEGEAQAAFMAKTKIVDAVASQDFDSILFGAPLLVRNLTVAGKRRVNGHDIEAPQELVTLDSVLSSLGLTLEELIDVAILTGTDFNPEGFSGIGPKTALKLIKTNKKLENIAKIQPELQKINYQMIRDMFLVPTLDTTVSLPPHKPVDEQAVIHILVDEHGFSLERITTALQRINTAIQARSQSLDAWFSP